MTVTPCRKQVLRKVRSSQRQQHAQTSPLSTALSRLCQTASCGGVTIGLAGRIRGLVFSLMLYLGLSDWGLHPTVLGGGMRHVAGSEVWDLNSIALASDSGRTRKVIVPTGNLRTLV